MAQIQAPEGRHRLADGASRCEKIPLQRPSLTAATDRSSHFFTASRAVGVRGVE